MSEDLPTPQATLSAHQVASVQTEMRAALGRPPERFSIPTFISMVSDEIEALRAEGRTDDDIADMIRAAGTVSVTAEDIRLHYASPGARGRPEGDPT